MYWQFMREFYQAGSGGSPSSAPPSAPKNTQSTQASVKQEEPQQPAKIEPQPAALEPSKSNISAVPQTLQAACVYDVSSGFSRFSSNWNRICFNDSTLCSGMEWLASFSKGGRKEFDAAIERVQTKNEPQRMRCEVTCHDGTSHWFEIDITPQESGEMICMIHCIDELIAIHREVQKYRAEAELANRNRSQFLSNMSHELRTPLNAIIGFSQVLQNCNQEYSEETRTDYLNHIQESGYLLLNKVRDLLDIAEIDAGKLRIRDEQLNLMDVVEDVLTLHATQIQEKQLKVEQIFTEKSVVIKADRAKITQAVSHLLANAINFSENFSTIWLRGEVTTAGSLALSVQDEGTGIRSDHLDAIRDGLAQPNAVFATDPRGIRLGLALAKEFTHLHDGNITLFSTFGEGTLANISLPESRIISVGVRIREKINSMREQHHPAQPINRAAKIKASFNDNATLVQNEA